jgi:N-acetyl-gamma-glutamyl-phosphate reductase
MKVGVVGASGYAGVELLRLCAAHPDFDVVVATAGSHAGDSVGLHTPSLVAAYPDLAYAATEPSELDGLDLVFVALPHGQSQHLIPALESELHRQELSGARLIAAPGCYPTAAILALAPLIEAGVLAVAAPGSTPADQPSAPSLIVDAASGVSGAGRAPKDHLQFGAVDEDFTAYGLLDHRHTVEMEQALGAPVLFTPHLAPMTRGILATCYGRPVADAGGAGGLSTAEAMAIVGRRYADERFVTVVDQPSTKATRGSNCAQVTVRVDPRTGWVLAIAALDNLVKGASGQAVQCANLALGLPEETGLPVAGVFP